MLQKPKTSCEYQNSTLSKQERSQNFFEKRNTLRNRNKKLLKSNFIATKNQQCVNFFVISLNVKK